MKIKKGFVLEKVGDSYLSCATGKLAKSFRGFIRLNESGAFLWKNLSEGDKTEAELEVLREKDRLDAILGKKEQKEVKKVEVKEKIEEITVHPTRKKIEYKYPSIELLEDNKAVKNRGVNDLKEKAR